MQTTFACLLQCIFHNFCSNARNFNVHLETGNTVFCSGNLKVHIAKAIFLTKNVRKNLIAVVMFALSDKTHCNTGNHFLHWNAGSEHTQRAAAGRSL